MEDNMHSFKQPLIPSEFVAAGIECTVLFSLSFPSVDLKIDAPLSSQTGCSRELIESVKKP